MTNVNAYLKAGGTLNLVDIDAVKTWITKHINIPPKSIYDMVHLILNNYVTKPNLKELHNKHIDKEWKRRPDAIKAMATKFSKACVMNN